jgi:acyl-CoA thioester hydrolase
VVTDVACRYRTPFRYDDEVVIRTFVAETGSRALKFGYELYDETGRELRATGSTSHVWVERESRRPVRAPEDVLAAFAAWQEQKTPP